MEINIVSVKFDEKKVEIIWEDENKQIRSIKSKGKPNTSFFNAFFDLAGVMAQHIAIDRKRVYVNGIEKSDESYVLCGQIAILGIEHCMKVKTHAIEPKDEEFWHDIKECDEYVMELLYLRPVEKELIDKAIKEAVKYVEGLREEDLISMMEAHDIKEQDLEPLDEEKSNER